MKTLKAMSALLTYPTPELVAAVPEIRAVLADEGILDALQRARLEPLLARLAQDDVYELQEAYILLFDRSRSLSLHLFEHVHGESRDRGQAMVDLKGVYAANGFGIATSDLPDFIPMFLEYASLLPEVEARHLLSEPAHILAAIGERLTRKQSDYAAVFQALAALAAEEPSAAAFEALQPEDDIDPADLKALDAAWAEEEVRFGPGAATKDCGVDSLAARFRQAFRPAPGVQLPQPPRPAVSHSSPARA